MRPILFEIGRLKVYSFGSFIALGAIIGGLILYWGFKKKGLKTKHLFDTVLYTLLISLIGARVVYYFAYQNQFRSFWEIIYFWQGGLASLGGLLAGFAAFLYFIRQQKQPIWVMLDAAGLALLVGWGIGKLGCHLSVCTLGRITDSSLAVASGYPVDLLSSLWAILLFVILGIFWLRSKFSDGVTFFLSIELLLLGELLIKTLRADFGEGLVKTETIIYLVLIVIAYLFFWRLHGPGFSNVNLARFKPNFDSSKLINTSWLNNSATSRITATKNSASQGVQALWDKLSRRG